MDGSAVLAKQRCSSLKRWQSQAARAYVMQACPGSHFLLVPPHAQLPPTSPPAAAV